MKAGTQGSEGNRDLQIKHACSNIHGNKNEASQTMKSSDTSPVRPKNDEEHVHPCKEAKHRKSASGQGGSRHQEEARWEEVRREKIRREESLQGGNPQEKL